MEEASPLDGVGSGTKLQRQKEDPWSSRERHRKHTWRKERGVGGGGTGVPQREGVTPGKGGGGGRRRHAQDRARAPAGSLVFRDFNWGSHGRIVTAAHQLSRCVPSGPWSPLIGPAGPWSPLIGPARAGLASQCSWPRGLPWSPHLALVWAEMLSLGLQA